MYFDEQSISTDGKSKYISKRENDPTYKIIYPENGDFDYTSTNSENGLRPVISLRPGMSYDGGDGSMDSPYVVDTN
jgi:hypothetical protein